MFQVIYIFHDIKSDRYIPGIAIIQTSATVKTEETVSVGRRKSLKEIN